METALNTPKVSFEDFYEVPNLKFDIEKLRADLDKILEEKKFNSPGVTHFGAIPLNQIPNDENSIKGNNIRGKFWTIADETGKEVSRDVEIEESKYTQLLPEFEKTYFKEVYETLSKKFKLGRVRLLLKEPRSTPKPSSAASDVYKRQLNILNFYQNLKKHILKKFMKL